jgi:hypothetical protein
MKGKALTKLPKNDSTTAADVYPPQLDYEKSNKDDDNGCDGEGDRLLIAHLSPVCSKVCYICTFKRISLTVSHFQKCGDDILVFKKKLFCFIGHPHR